MTTAHDALVATMTAPGAANVRAYIADDQLWLAMAGQTFPLRPGATVTRGELDAAVYSTNRCDDVLIVADDGTVFGTTQAFTTAAAPLCALADAGAREAIVKNLAAMLSTRVMQ